MSSVLQSLKEKHEDFCRKVLGFDPFQEPQRFVQFNDFLSEALQKIDAWHVLLEELTKRADTTAGLVSYLQAPLHLHSIVHCITNSSTYIVIQQTHCGPWYGEPT